MALTWKTMGKDFYDHSIIGIREEGLEQIDS